jgi:hypothetical protein
LPIAAPVFAFHTRAVQSSDAVTTHAPSGLNTARPSPPFHLLWSRSGDPTADIRPIADPQKNFVLIMKPGRIVKDAL